MKLLFKQDTFSEEFKDLLGFVDADVSFTSIRSELFTATREMITTIGQETYDSFYELYDSDIDAWEEDEIEKMHLIRYPIAMNAYRLAAPSTDLAHTTSGRMMRTDQHQARPFPWMIDRNNEANDRKFFRGMDDLLIYLFEDEDFKKTINYKKLKSTFVNTTADFEEYFPIHSRYLLIKLRPGLKQAERDFIKPRVGKEKFTELKEAFKTADGVPEEEKDLLALIKEACVYHALQWSMSRLTITLLPEGILQRFQSDRSNTKASKTPEMLQARLADQKFGEDAARAYKAIEAYITPALVEETTTETETSIDPFNPDDDLFATT